MKVITKIILTLSAGASICAGIYIIPLVKKKQLINTIKDVLVKDTLDHISSDDSLITLIAVGDMMLGTNFPNASHLPPKDYNLLGPLEEYLKNADITFGNLEGTVLNEGGEVKKCDDPSKCYAFRQPESVLEHLKNSGFDLISVANNHMGDFGDAGRINTQKKLREHGFRYAGLETCPWDTLTVKGIKIGFTAFAPNNACLQLNDYDLLRKIVKSLNDSCDIVIVSFHGGAEGSTKTRITNAHEIFYGEDRGNVSEFARVAIDAGADVILGHGPHVTRAVDLYKNRFITYSMGNFCTYSRFNLKGVNGIAPVFKLYLKKNGEFVRSEVLSIQQLGEGGPIPDPEFRVFKELEKLTKADSPEAPFIFMNNTISLR